MERGRYKSLDYRPVCQSKNENVRNIMPRRKFDSHSNISSWVRSVILNRGPHGPPGANLQLLGGNTEHLGNWGGMDPFGGNQPLWGYCVACYIMTRGQ